MTVAQLIAAGRWARDKRQHYDVVEIADSWRDTVVVSASSLERDGYAQCTIDPSGCVREDETVAA